MDWADDEGEVVCVGPGLGREAEALGESLAALTAGPSVTPVVGVRTCVEAVVGVEVDEVE